MQSLNAELNALEAESKLVQKELPYLKKVTTAIPPNVDQPEIVNELNVLANDTGCKLGSVNPADTVAPSGTTGLSTISVDFGLSGTHKNVFRFLNDFYKLQRLMTINTVSLSPAGTSPNILAIGDGMQYSLTVTANGVHHLRNASGEHWINGAPFWTATWSHLEWHYRRPPVRPCAPGPSFRC